MESLRSCKECSYRGVPESFPKAHEIKGKIYFRHVCSVCYQKSKRRYKHVQRRKLQEYKKTLSCNRCGFSDHRALHFHRRDPEDKSYSIGRMNRGHSFPTKLKEIAKCDVLCANCHAIEHYSPVQ